jgi:hypothetical protein
MVNPAKVKLAIIVGPTAVGKSEVASELAPEIGAEIVNADSQQVYRYMDIGTGKPSEAERRRVPHHLIDVVNPDEDFNVAIFRRLAMASIDISAAVEKSPSYAAAPVSTSKHSQGAFSPGRRTTLRCAPRSWTRRNAPAPPLFTGVWSDSIPRPPAGFIRMTPAASCARSRFWSLPASR